MGSMDLVQQAERIVSIVEHLDLDSARAEGLVRKQILYELVEGYPRIVDALETIVAVGELAPGQESALTPELLNEANQALKKLTSLGDRIEVLKIVLGEVTHGSNEHSDERMNTINEIVNALRQTLADAAAQWASRNTLRDTFGDRLDAQVFIRGYANALALVFAQWLADFEKERKGAVALNDDAILDMWREALRGALALTRSKVDEVAAGILRGGEAIRPHERIIEAFKQVDPGIKLCFRGEGGPGFWHIHGPLQQTGEKRCSTHWVSVEQYNGTVTTREQVACVLGFRPRPMADDGRCVRIEVDPLGSSHMLNGYGRQTHGLTYAEILKRWPDLHDFARAVIAACKMFTAW